MGKAVPRGIKSKAATLMKLYSDKFGVDFEKNKQFLNSLDLPFSKLTRNLLAGYISKQLKNAS
jgi:ribosomal protein S17E